MSFFLCNVEKRPSDEKDEITATPVQRAARISKNFNKLQSQSNERSKTRIRIGIKRDVVINKCLFPQSSRLVSIVRKTNGQMSEPSDI